MDDADDVNPVNTPVPPELQVYFPFSHFNAIQSAVWPTIDQTTSNVVGSAPTASGKTVVF